MTAGLLAAGVMSAVRLVAHRAGLIERMIPQVVEERAAGEARRARSAGGDHTPGDDRSPGDAAQQLLAEALHHGIGLASGAVLGALAARPRTMTSVGYGLAIWGVPALGVLRLPRVRRAGAAVDAVAHAVFGAVLAFAMRELAAQPRLTPAPTRVPLLRRVG